MYNALIVGVVQREHNLNSEPPHNRVWDQSIFNPSAETPQRLAHEGEDETDVGAVRTLVLKVVQQMANVSMA